MSQSLCFKLPPSFQLLFELGPGVRHGTEPFHKLKSSSVEAKFKKTNAMKKHGYYSTIESIEELNQATLILFTLTNSVD